jgi:putative ABC transport system permease protein
MYYLRLALLGLRRNPALSALIVAAIGIGIGVCMTAYTLFHATSGDPLPAKSARLHVPQLDSWGPDKRDGDEPPIFLSYRDAVALTAAGKAMRQTALYSFRANVLPADERIPPFRVRGRGANADFFAMFDAPFRYGGSWSKRDDQQRSNVVVLGNAANERLFGGENSVGRTVTLDGREYSVSGVLRSWDMQPRLYDLVNGAFGGTEDIFMPFATAVDGQFSVRGYGPACGNGPQPEWSALLASECVWVHMWIEVPDQQAARAFEDFLRSYAAEQQSTGRFNWAPLIRLRNARQWLAFVQVVPGETRISLAVACGFLIVCLVNAVALILAKFGERKREVGIRRALGASRRSIFAQHLVESGLLGAGAGLVGLALTLLGLAGQRAVLPEDLRQLAVLDAHVVFVVMGVSLIATIAAAAYPAWRASAVEPGLSARDS